MTQKKPTVTFITATPQECGLVKERGYDARCKAEDGDLLNVILRIRDAHGYAVILLDEDASADLWEACNRSGVPSHIPATERAKSALANPETELEEFLKAEHENAVSTYEKSARHAVDSMLSHYGIHNARGLAAEIATGGATKDPIPSGIDDLDRALDGGLPRGGLVTLGALSSMGKTTLANQIADFVASSGTPVLFCTCEQSRYEIVSMSLSRLAGVSEYDEFGNALYATRSVIQRGEWTDRTRDRIAKAGAAYTETIADNMHIMECEDQPSATDVRRAAEAVRFIHGGTSPFVVVDYLQILRPENDRRDERLAVNDAVSVLRKLARDLDTTVLLISALNRASMSKGVSMSAFRESSGIEYSSDLLLGLQPRGMAQEIGEQTSETQINQTATRYVDNYRDEEKKRGEIRILKNRIGRVPSKGIPVSFDPRSSTFMSDHDPWTPPSSSAVDNALKGATSIKKQRRRRS